MARPRKEINWVEFDKLVGLQATQEEVAAWFHCSVDLLEDAALRDRGVSLAELWYQKRDAGRLKLRKLQMDLIERGGPGAATMAIYLDKKHFPLENPNKDHPVSPIDPVPKSEKRTFVEFCQKAGYPIPFVKQIEMMAFGMLHNGEPRLLLGARGYGKSDYVTVLGTAYDVYLNGTNTSNLIISKSRIRNAAMIEECASALKANGVDLEKENSHRLRVAGLIGKDDSIEVLTIKSSFRGRHPKRIIMDDPVTEEDTSEAMRALVKKKYDEAYKLCRNIVIIGQPAHQFDLYAELASNLKTMRIPHGEIPELDADLEAMAIAGVDRASIEMSYHLRVPVNSASIFSNMKFTDEMPTGNSVAFIDPSDGGDYTAISIVKGYMQGVAVEGYAFKLSWYNALDQMVAHLKAHNVKKVAFETNATGSQPILQLRSILKPFDIAVVGVYSTTNKHSTILSAGSMAHLIHLSRKSDRVYTDQVLKYEAGSKHDDAPDSMARALEWLGLIKGKK